MKDTTDVKDTIISATTELIQEYNGDVSKITLRKISERAGVGLGLINYHFESKDKLITLCVQRIISNVVMCFVPDKEKCSTDDKMTDQKRLADCAKQVYDFLFDNIAISTISILGDMQNYNCQCNSVYTQKGFSKSVKNNIDENARKVMMFVLTSSMQVAFLAGDSSKEILGYDLRNKAERDKYIDVLVGMVFNGAD